MNNFIIPGNVKFQLVMKTLKPFILSRDISY